MHLCIDSACKIKSGRGKPGYEAKVSSKDFRVWFMCKIREVFFMVVFMMVVSGFSPMMASLKKNNVYDVDIEYQTITKWMSPSNYYISVIQVLFSLSIGSVLSFEFIRIRS